MCDSKSIIVEFVESLFERSQRAGTDTKRWGEGSGGRLLGGPERREPPTLLEGTIHAFSLVVPLPPSLYCVRPSLSLHTCVFYLICFVPPVGQERDDHNQKSVKDLVLKKGKDLVIDKKDADLVLKKDADLVLKRDADLVLKKGNDLVLKRDKNLVLKKDADLVLKKDADLVLKKGKYLVLKKDKDLVLKKGKDLVIDKETVLPREDDTGHDLETRDNAPNQETNTDIPHGRSVEVSHVTGKGGGVSLMTGVIGQMTKDLAQEREDDKFHPN